MKKIPVIIIDDERAAREEIKRMLHSYPAFEIVGEARNTDEAKEQIASLTPALIFLDIQMPGGSGFDLLESLDEAPGVIFVTAFNEHAVKAFEVNALDYLMKPIREERFAKTIERVLAAEATSQREQKIFIKDGQQLHFVQWSKVYLIESVDNYARLYVDGKKILYKSSLNQLENKLDGNIFFRVNRAQMINTQFIQKIYTTPRGRLQVTLQTGDLLEVSERQAVKFKSRGSDNK